MLLSPPGGGLSDTGRECNETSAIEAEAKTAVPCIEPVGLSFLSEA